MAPAWSPGQQARSAARNIPPDRTRSDKKNQTDLFAYIENPVSFNSGLVQPPDQVVARFARTTYPYSLGILLC